ncbi:hypothetical protein J2S44_005687 [Catenuloplanes niger]|uniref:Uncharacterized protein n=1 Tax=Catenuloplanes niger TaxID=587534 RepID=A0AAE4CVH6_9ACTN|nr:hypothetical protein [Catenuloplanes niger]
MRAGTPPVHAGGPHHPTDTLIAQVKEMMS